MGDLMASKSKRVRMAPVRNLKPIFLYWAFAVFIIKLITIFNVPGNAWLGADGENYISAYEAIIKDGLFSTERLLHYWPAGYPIFLWLLSFLGKSWLFATIAIAQSLVYSAAVFYFVYQLSKTKIRNYSYATLIFLLFNPTLSLASICIGYESLAASGLLVVLGLIIQDLASNSDKIFIRNIIYSSLTVGVISLFQPRLLLSGLVGLTIWVMVRKPLISAISTMIMATVIVAVSPALLIFRNQNANGFSAISTNLGITMNLGAGDGANGSYDINGTYGVDCPIIDGNASIQDRHLVNCVINWYVQNPKKSIKLFLNKSLYFWSPWVNNGFLGEVKTGSMKRNPWLKVNPIINIATTSQQGEDLVKGNIGKSISWMWMLGSMAMMLLGYWQLWKTRGIERVIALFAATQIILNWGIALGTLGDHRQRLPILGIVIFLQVIGLKTVFKAKKVLLTPGPELPSKFAK